MSQLNRYPFPEAAEPFFGNILDLDGQEHVPPNHWENEFGSITNALPDVVGGWRRSTAIPATIPISKAGRGLL